MADEDDGFIGMPPGIFDSGTFKLPPKAERPRAPENEDIVFVQAAPGVPVAVPPVPPAVVDPGDAAWAAPVSHETQRAIPDPADAPEAAPAPADFTPPAAQPPAAQPPAETPVPTAPPAPAPTGWRLVLADGAQVPVERALIVGRNPAAFEQWPGAALLAVADTTQSVSKTHAAFEVDDSGLWVHDLNSTNGVWVVHGEDVTEVAPGRRVNVPAGSSVELGDYVLRAER